MAIMDQINRGGDGETGGKRNSITLKLIAIVILVVLFIIPSSMVEGLINERSSRQDQTIQEVGSSWGGAQSAVGPILVIPYTEVNPKTNLVTNKNIYALPDKVAINTNVKTQIRSRGIYDVPVYNSDIALTGNFSIPNIAELGIAAGSVNWERAFVVLGIPDMRGVEEQITLDWNGKKTQFSPGATVDAVNSGAHAPVQVDVVASDAGNVPAAKQYNFSVALKLRGSKTLAFVPVGKETTVTMTADWPHPSFAGAFLPREHNITEKGFTATWQVLDLNRNFPSKWKTDDNIIIPFEYIAVVTTDPAYYLTKPYMADGTVQGNIEAGTFGVSLFVPVDLYQKSTRSAKYAMAVIALVFTMVFFIELTAKRKIHPVQYALIGFALVVFYTLLLSLAEHIGFGWAYVVASIGIIGMITLFSKSVIGSWSRALTTGGLLSVFYIFVYVLLQLQDFALLLGSIALFVILGVIMYISRKIDWYGAGKLYA